MQVPEDYKSSLHYDIADICSSTFNLDILTKTAVLGLISKVQGF